MFDEGWYVCSCFLPRQSGGIERNAILGKSSGDGGIHRLPRAWLMDVGGMLLQVREVAVCRAVRHDGDVTQNGVKLSRALGLQVYLAGLLYWPAEEERKTMILCC